MNETVEYRGHDAHRWQYLHCPPEVEGLYGELVARRLRVAGGWLYNVGDALTFVPLVRAGDPT